MAEKKTKEAKKPAPEMEKPTAPAAEAPAPAKGGFSLKLIVIVLAAMVVGGGGAFVAMKFLGGSQTEQAQIPADEFSETVTTAVETEEPIVAPTKGEAPAPAEGGGGHGAPAAEGGEGAAIVGPQIVNLEPFTTNLNDGTGRSFLKVSMGLEVSDQGAADELKRVLPNITDRILMLLSSQTKESILTMDGKERLRSQILREANTFMTAHKINRVVYSQFIVQ
ncbi:MAG: flagellar basal body-associated FliL family protein [Deltaproteobacteria bacterium]|jgi:flagellar FliL protein|nr:flagellar basal body-associated FliL family protein [Deltaproteobacteria bacterium]